MKPNDDLAEAIGAMLPRLRRFAFALSRHPADADDLAALAVERALRSRAQFTPGSRLDSWLFRITRRGRLLPRQANCRASMELRTSSDRPNSPA
jgi:RNA polymerase sigma-70 factor (ECF subfamily)